MPATMHYSTKPPVDSHNQLPLTDHVRRVVSTYLKNMVKTGITPENVYELVMSEIEAI